MKHISKSKKRNVLHFPTFLLYCTSCYTVLDSPLKGQACFRSTMMTWHTHKATKGRPFIRGKTLPLCLALYHSTNLQFPFSILQSLISQPYHHTNGCKSLCSDQKLVHWQPNWWVNKPWMLLLLWNICEWAGTVLWWQLFVHLFPDRRKCKILFISSWLK